MTASEIQQDKEYVEGRIRHLLKRLAKKHKASGVSISTRVHIDRFEGSSKIDDVFVSIKLTI